LENGAEVNAQNESGKTAMMYAAFSGKVKIIQRLKYGGGSYEKCDKSGSFVIHYAIDGGNLDCIQWLLVDGVDVNTRDASFGWTPLIRAACINSTKEVAELLIRFGADINAKDKDCKTALIISVINGNQPFVEALVEHGADLGFKNEYGKTAYDLAVSMDRRRVIKYFDDYAKAKVSISEKEKNNNQLTAATTTSTTNTSLKTSTTSLRV
jgi:ankyrin repeat protein